MRYFTASVLWRAYTGAAGNGRDLRDKRPAVVIMPVPHEFAIGGVFFPPLLVASALGVALAVWTTRVLNRYRLAHHFFYPPLVILALSVIYSILIGTFIIGA